MAKPMTVELLQSRRLRRFLRLLGCSSAAARRAMATPGLIERAVRRGVLVSPAKRNV
jgi:hypothetical protein